MSEELKRRGRVAAALIAGPAVTVGMLGVGAAPVMAQETADSTGQEEATEGNVDNTEDGETATEGEGAQDQVSETDNPGDAGDQDEGDAGSDETAEDDAGEDAENSESADEDSDQTDDPNDGGDDPEGAGDSDNGSDGGEGTETSDSGPADPTNDGAAETDSEDVDPDGSNTDAGPEGFSTLQDDTQDPEDESWEDNPLDVSVDPEDESVFEDAYDGQLEPYVVTQDAPASQQAEGDPAAYIPEGDIVPVLFRDDAPGVAYITQTAAAPGAYVQDWEQYLTPYQQDEDGGDGEDEADLQEVTPEAPGRYDNTVVIPEVEGVTYEISAEQVDPGSEIELSEDEPWLSVAAYADEGYEFGDDVEVNNWSFEWQPGYEDIWPTDPPEDWEADEDRWYSNVPETHLPSGYADWIQVHADNANQNAESWQEFAADTQVHLEPSTDAETIGDMFPTDGSVWWGYLEDEDFWMVVHQYTGATGFLPGESHLGEDPEEEDATLSIEEDPVLAGEEVTVTGTGFEPGEDVEFTFDGQSVGTESANNDGEATLEFTLPEDTESGPYTLEAVGLESEIQTSLTVHVGASDEGNDDEEDDDTDEGGSDEGDGSGSDDEEGGSGEEGSGTDDADEEPNAELTADNNEVVAGEEVTLVGENFAAGEDVDFSINPELGTFAADDGGVVTAVVTVPGDTEPGEHTITATGVSSERSDSVGITVVEPEGSGAEEADDGEDVEAAPAGGTSDDASGDDAAPADGESPAADAGGEELATTGSTAGTVGLASGLLLLIGGGLAALGFRNRLGRQDADA